MQMDSLLSAREQETAALKHSWHETAAYVANEKSAGWRASLSTRKNDLSAPPPSSPLPQLPVPC